MFKKLLALICLITSAIFCCATEKHSVVRISGFDKLSEYRVLSNEELTEFKKELAEESKYFLRITNEIRKDWDKDNDGKGKRIPSLERRSLKVIGDYSNKADADKKLQTFATTGKESEKDAILASAVALANEKLSDISGGKLKGSVPGSPPSVDSGQAGGDVKLLNISNYVFKVTGTMHKHLGGSNFYINPDSEQRYEGHKLRPLNVNQRGKGAFGVDDSWIGKKVESTGLGQLTYWHGGYAVMNNPIIKTLTLLEADK